MTNVRSIGLLAGLVCACAVTAEVFAAGQAAEGPVPNFSSLDFPWVSGNSDFLPPISGVGPVTYDKAHPVMARNPNNRGEVVEAPMRLADVSNPNLKPWVVERLKEANAELIAKGLRTASRANCLPPGVPEFLTFAGGFEPIYFIQTPKEVLMIHQANTEVRHVYMNVPHSARPAPSWFGESVGHYDGDELVVDTIGFNDKTFVDDNYNLPHTTELHVTERFKLMNEGKTLQVNLTVEDPGAFNAPWSAIVRYRRVASAQLLVEEPCAENNAEHLSNFFHIPTATKRDF
jgi:hypothetical protein